MPKKEKWYSRNGENVLYTNSPTMGWEFLVKEETHGMDYLDIEYYICGDLDVCRNTHDSDLKPVGAGWAVKHGGDALFMSQISRPID